MRDFHEILNFIEDCREPSRMLLARLQRILECFQASGTDFWSLTYMQYYVRISDFLNFFMCSWLLSSVGLLDLLLWNVDELRLSFLLVFERQSRTEIGNGGSTSHPARYTQLAVYRAYQVRHFHEISRFLESRREASRKLLGWPANVL